MNNQHQSTLKALLPSLSHDVTRVQEGVDSLPGAERLRWLRPGAEAGPGGGAL